MELFQCRSLAISLCAFPFLLLGLSGVEIEIVVVNGIDAGYGNVEVERGDNVTMRCQVSGLMHGDTFTWQYDLQDLTTRGRIAVTQELLSTSDSSWDGALVLTVSNVRDGDSGTYVCSVRRPGVETPEITAKQAFLTVYFFPGDGNPTCEPGGPVTIYFGEGTTLACWTDEGNPTVDLVISSSDLDPTMIWSKTDTDDNITKRAYWTADAFRGEFAFSCEIASSRYPGERRNCTIGPIRVEERPLPTTPQTYFSQSVSESATPALESSTTFPSLSHTNDSVANSSEVSLTIGSASTDNSVTFTRSNSPAVTVSDPSAKDMFTFGGTQSDDTSNERNLPQTTSRSDLNTIRGVSDGDPFTTSASGGYSKSEGTMTVSPVFMFNLTTLMSNLKSTSVLNTPITPPSNTETIPAETFLTARQTVHTTTTMLSTKSSPIQTHRASSSPTEKVPNEQRTAETSQIVLQSATGAIWTEEGAEQVTATLSPSTSEVVPTEARIVKTTMRVPPSTTEFVPSEQGTVGTSPGVTQFKTESTPTGERTEQITATLLSPESESVPMDALNVTTISGSTLSSTEIVPTEQSTVKTTQIELPLVTETIPIEPRTEQITTTPLSSTTEPTQTETHILQTTPRASPCTIDVVPTEQRTVKITSTVLPSGTTTESVPTELRTVRIWPVVPTSETETIRIEPRTEQITATLSSSTYEPPPTETMTLKTTLRPSSSTTEIITIKQRTAKSTQILLPSVTDALSTEDRTEQMTGTLLSSTLELIPTKRTTVETPSRARQSTNQIVPTEQRITETTPIVLPSETEGISTGLSTGKSTLPVVPTTAGMTSTEAITVKTTQITVPSTGQTSTEHGVSTFGNMPTVHFHTTETMIPTESKTPVTAPSTPASSTSQSVPTESWNVKSSEKAILTTVPTERRTELTTSSPLPGVSTSDTYEPTELTPTKPSEESKQPSPNWAIAFAVTVPPSILCLVIVVILFFKIRHMKRFEWTAATDALMSRDQQERQSERMNGTVNCASNEFIQLDKV
ncbi:flocculation protein FLO11-like isoform X1 [Acanthaster planci]|uniref:Flocculation protein FLO11-like isoform X1 n=1 Tax=Acanthaster planci TaxID=133434 RepID=A0A8B7YCB5_ACAPL|nr:flocculation protein FLO11-like isoform X1 [Acanthaster planci]